MAGQGPARSWRGRAGAGRAAQLIQRPPTGAAGALEHWLEYASAKAEARPPETSRRYGKAGAWSAGADGSQAVLHGLEW
jgi:hypothetical protein